MWPSSLLNCSMVMLSHGPACPASTSTRRRPTPPGNTHTHTLTHSHNTHSRTHTHTTTHTHTHTLTHSHSPVYIETLGTRLVYIMLCVCVLSHTSRIFVKILFQELAEFMGMAKLNERLRDPYVVIATGNHAVVAISLFLFLLSLGSFLWRLRACFHVTIQKTQDSPSISSPLLALEDSRMSAAQITDNPSLTV